MTQTSPPVPPLLPQQTAFFLDVDGTLAEIVPDPDKARVAPSDLAVLERLSDKSGGALALISGRSIAQLDKILSPLRFPAVGVHGLEKRLDGGEVTRFDFDHGSHADLVDTVQHFVAQNSGLHVETKPGAVALHFRKRPDLADICTQFMQKQAESDPLMSLLTGKMVVELIFGGQTKGDAVAGLMESPPFAGRRAFFAGDDVTDEAAFHCVNMLDGVSVKVGDGNTCARYRVADRSALLDYLATLLV